MKNVPAEALWHGTRVQRGRPNQKRKPGHRRGLSVRDRLLLGLPQFDFVGLGWYWFGPLARIGADFQPSEVLIKAAA